MDSFYVFLSSLYLTNKSICSLTREYEQSLLGQSFDFKWARYVSTRDEYIWTKSIQMMTCAYKITHLNRSITTINMIKIIITKTVAKTFICVFVKAKISNQ